MTDYYKGNRIDELLEIVGEMEKRLKALTADADPIQNPFSMAQYEEVAQGYTSLALAKAKLKALQGEPM
jgi:hypothetical protein